MRARTVATVLIVLSALVAAGARFGSRYVDRVHGRDVILLIGQHAPEEVAFNRELFDPEEFDAEERVEAVVGLYGSNPDPRVDRILFPDETRLIVPDEDPSLTLYPRGSDADGAYAYQSVSMLYVADRVTYVAAGAFALLVLLRLTLLRRPSGDGAGDDADAAVLAG